MLPTVPLDRERVHERVVAMRMQQYDDVRIARTLAAEGAEPGVPESVMAALDNDERMSFRRNMKRAVAVGAVLCGTGFALDFFLGTSRSMGALLLIVVAAAMAMAIVWLLRSVREG